MESEVRHPIRRLRSTDLDDFRGLQKHAAHYEHSKSLHNKWVEKATREIKEGDRIGYGLFDKSKRELLGCILLRRTSSNVIELKNLVVSSAIPPRSEARAKAYKALIAHAEKASKYRGFSQLEIELLSTDYEQIEIFLSLGYSIQPSHESVPAIGIPHYLLWKHVQPEYHGDPFDYLSMARWLLAERLHWSVDPNPEKIDFGVSSEQYAFRLRFEVPIRAPRGQERAPQAAADHEKREVSLENPFMIVGDCIVDCGMGEVADFEAILNCKAKSEGLAVRFMLSTRQIDGLQEVTMRAGARPILGGDLLRMIGYSSGHEPFKLKKEDVRSVVLPVGPSDIEALRNFCTYGTPFSYVVLNGVGNEIYQRLAQEEDDDEETHNQELLAIFCADTEPASTESDERRMAVVGWAQIEEALPCRFHLVEGALRDRNTLWRGSSNIRFFLNQFSVNFHEGDMVFVLHLRRPRLLEVEVPLYVIGADDAGVKPLLAGAQLYGFSACYAEKLTSLVRNRPFLEWGAVPLAPSTDLPDIELLNALESTLEVINASQWLQAIIRKELSADASESLRELREEINREKTAIRRELQRDELSSQPALFALPASSPSATSLLKDTLRAVRSAVYEFFWEPQKSNPEDWPGQANWHAKNVCVRMARALSLGRGLGLRTGPEALRKWLNAVSWHERTYLVGLTFSSRHREEIVEPVAKSLAKKCTEERIFYDAFHQAEISQLRARELLSKIYANECDLIVAFLSNSYGEDWTGMEWERVVRLARAEPHRLLLVKLTDFDWKKLGVDEANAISWDIRKNKQADSGYISPSEICKGILQKLEKARFQERPLSPSWAEAERRQSEEIEVKGREVGGGKAPRRRKVGTRRRGGSLPEAPG